MAADRGMDLVSMLFWPETIRRKVLVLDWEARHQWILTAIDEVNWQYKKIVIIEWLGCFCSEHVIVTLGGTAACAASIAPRGVHRVRGSKRASAGGQHCGV